MASEDIRRNQSETKHACVRASDAARVWVGQGALRDVARCSPPPYEEHRSYTLYGQCGQRKKLKQNFTAENVCFVSKNSTPNNSKTEPVPVCNL